MRRSPGRWTAVRAAACGVLLLTPSAALAQQGTVRSGLIGLFYESSGFREGEKDALIGLIQAQTTTFPVGSSAGGFTWTFDRRLGVPTRRSQSFGPMFAERPLTTGRYRLNVSLAFQRTEWQSIADWNLSDGLVFVTSDFSEGERFTQRSVIHLTTEQTIVNATFGLSDRIDVGIIVPFVRQKVSGDLYLQLGGLFGDAPAPTRESHSGSSSGLGDITLRGKVTLPVTRFDLAAVGDVRLATGDDRQLLGSGATQGTAMIVGGAKSGFVVPHFNVGYMFGSSGIAEPLEGWGLEQGEFRPSNEFKYNLGAEFMVSTPITISGDIVGRTMFKSPVPVQETRASSYFTHTGLTIKRGTMNLLLGAVSAKVMVSNSWLITAAVAFPLNNNGLKPGITPVIGFERAF